MNYVRLIRIPSSGNICDILKNSQQVNAPKNVENTILNDDEINDIMSYLMYLQSEYFEDIPLNKDLCKTFVWNLPKEVYDAYNKSRILEIPDCLNPLFYLYIFCVKDPYSSIGLFLNSIINMGLNETDLIENKISEYYDLLESSDED